MKFDELFNPKPGSRAEFQQKIIEELNQEIKSLKSEVKEQAVLNGKGSEREARYLAACSEYRAKLDKLEAENAALRALADHAETLLCNSLPMAHCSQSDWDEVIRRWRDQKHDINVV
jgi:hypothetical protein